MALYVGSTVDLERRLWQHENGEGAAYTRRRRPLRLVWSLPFDRVDEAWAIEKHLQGSGRATDAWWLRSELCERHETR